jgi:hypothetical protein
MLLADNRFRGPLLETFAQPLGAAAASPRESNVTLWHLIEPHVVVSSVDYPMGLSQGTVET